MSERFNQLLKAGQSFWLDNIRREWLQDGSLEAMVKDQGLRGLTSNPAILHQAITKSSAYDQDIEELAQAGLPAASIFERLAIADIRGAADVLRPVYDASDGVDGFVSLEVAPTLAHDARGTLAEAKRLFAAVDRPNVMIKVPGTKAGNEAIEELIYLGIHVNVTLLFSTIQYAQSAFAYIRGIERRHREGLDLQVASVASIFMSRIDTLVDQLLSERLLLDADHNRVVLPLFGQAAVASAKGSYARFKDIFESPRFTKLSAAGARVQRPLWASTSTKNPTYPDVKYVEPLIGPHTVNTMPDATVAAFADHGEVVSNAIEGELEHAYLSLERLNDLGIDCNAVCQQLQDEGILKFIKPYGELIRDIERKRRGALAGPVVEIECERIGAQGLDSLRSVMAELQLLKRVWTCDPLLEPKLDPAGVYDRSGCFDEHLAKAAKFAATAVVAAPADQRDLELYFGAGAKPQMVTDSDELKPAGRLVIIASGFTELEDLLQRCAAASHECLVITEDPAVAEAQPEALLIPGPSIASLGLAAPLAATALGLEPEAALAASRWLANTFAPELVMPPKGARQDLSEGYNLLGELALLLRAAEQAQAAIEIQGNEQARLWLDERFPQRQAKDKLVISFDGSPAELRLKGLSAAGFAGLYVLAKRLG